MAKYNNERLRSTIVRSAPVQSSSVFYSWLVTQKSFESHFSTKSQLGNVGSENHTRLTLKYGLETGQNPASVSKFDRNRAADGSSWNNPLYASKLNFVFSVINPGFCTPPTLHTVLPTSQKGLNIIPIFLLTANQDTVVRSDVA